MQTECRTTSLLDCYAEVLLILCKDNYFIAVEVKKNGDYLPKSNPTTTIWVKNPRFFALILPSSSLRVPFLLHQVQCPNL
jgi:hypothetical protein